MGQCRMKSLFLKGLRKYSNSQDVVCSKRRRTAHSWMNTTQIRGGNEPRFLKLNKAQNLLKTFQHGKFSVNSWDPGSFNPQLKITYHWYLAWARGNLRLVPSLRIGYFYYVVQKLSSTLQCCSGTYKLLLRNSQNKVVLHKVMDGSLLSASIYRSRAYICLSLSSSSSSVIVS